MRVLKSVRQLREIGPLVGRLRLPMSGRKARGQKTVCSACGRSIEEDFFIGGFVAGHPNIMLHEACAPPECDVLP